MQALTDKITIIHTLTGLCFQEFQEKFEKAGAQVVGIGSNDPSSHKSQGSTETLQYRIALYLTQEEFFRIDFFYFSFWYMRRILCFNFFKTCSMSCSPQFTTMFWAILGSINNVANRVSFVGLFGVSAPQFDIGINIFAMPHRVVFKSNHTWIFCIQATKYIKCKSNHTWQHDLIDSWCQEVYPLLRY